MSIAPQPAALTMIASKSSGSNAARFCAGEVERGLLGARVVMDRAAAGLAAAGSTTSQPFCWRTRAVAALVSGNMASATQPRKRATRARFGPIGGRTSGSRLAGPAERRQHRLHPPLLTSHVLEVVERLCTHIAIIQHGRLVASGSLDELRSGVKVAGR